MTRTLLLVALMLLSCWALALDPLVPEMDGWGSLRGVRINGELVPVRTMLRVVSPGWQKISEWNQWGTKDVKYTFKDGIRRYSGRLPFADTSVTYREEVRTDGNLVRTHVDATSQNAAAAQGIYLFVLVPVDEFIGGEARLLSATGPSKSAVSLPATKPADAHLLAGEAKGVQWHKGDLTVTIEFDKPQTVVVQDDRVFGAETYSFFFPLHSGDLLAGQTATTEITVAAKAPVDTAPATITVRPDQAYTLDGFGGSFVYSAESPVSRYMLDNLSIAWSRVWLPLHEWEPQYNADSPSDIKLLSANDKPNSHIRAAMEISQELQKRKIPYIASIWPVPKWLLLKPWDTNPFTHEGVIPREKWDALAQSIGSYLLYAREKYGVEPQMLSFNECDYGVMVKCTPEEHRDMIKLLGKHFEKLGLKTKLLIGDVAGPRDMAKYVEPTLADPEALKYASAIAFHSWGGASDAQFAAWHTAAERAGKPLLVTEAGLDANAWNYAGVFNEYWYAHGEAMQYLQMLQHSRPQGIILWEYTEDYSIVDIDKSVQPWRLSPAKRFYVQKQLSNLSPRAGQVLPCTTSRADLRSAAIRATDGKIVLHITSDGAARKVKITGLPDATYKATVTDISRDMAALPAVKVTNRTAELELPAWSLVTLAAP